MAGLAIELPAHGSQTEFNLRRWEEILADSFYATLEHRIETDRHGHIIMTPPPGRPHGSKQSLIVQHLARFLPLGEIVTECPISTSDGVRAADIAWLSPQLSTETAGDHLLKAAPEICVEVLSPSNTTSEMNDKKALYFDAGAKEVWFCRHDGRMEFYLGPEGGAHPKSTLCPDFPGAIGR